MLGTQAGSPTVVSTPASTPPAPAPAALNSDLSPLAYMDQCFARVRGAQTPAQLDELSLQFSADERQLRQVRRTTSSASAARTTTILYKTFDLLQRAVKAKRIELEGGNPRVQPPFTDSETALALARTWAVGAQRSTEGSINAPGS